MDQQTEKNIDAFHQAVELMRVIYETSGQLLTLEGEMNEQVALVLQDRGVDATQLTQRQAEAEARLEALCLAHPEWFTSVKKIKTPHGVFAMTSGTTTQIKDQEATIRRIRRNGMGRQLLRLRVEIDFEAAERLAPELHARLGIERVTKDKFSVTPMKITAGKAVAQAKARAATAEKGAPQS